NDKNGYSFFLQAIGQLWLLDQKVKWKNLYLNEIRQRIPLPTYPFERISHWIHPSKRKEFSTNTDSDGLLYTITWERDRKLSSALKPAPIPKAWLVFCARAKGELFKKIKALNDWVYAVIPGKSFQRLKGNTFIIDPANKQHYEKLFESISL